MQHFDWVLLNFQQMIYILSLSFQLSGALMLIFCCWKDIDSLVLNRIFSANVVVERNDHNEVVVNRDKLFKAYKAVLKDRIAFILMALGYLLNVFSSNDNLNPWFGLVLIIIVGLIVMWIGNRIVVSLANKRSMENGEYDFDQLESNIEGDVFTPISDKEIDDLF